MSRFIGVGAVDREREDGVRFLEHAGRKKSGAVCAHRKVGRVGAEVPCKGERDAHLGGELRAGGARPEEVERRQRSVVGHRANFAERITGRKLSTTPRDELAELLEEIIRGEGLPRAAERECCQSIGARRSPDAEIDPAGIYRL